MVVEKVYGRHTCGAAAATLGLISNLALAMSVQPVLAESAIAPLTTTVVTPESPQLSNLQSLCNPASIQAVAATISSSQVTVRQIEESPKFSGGTRFVKASGGVPAYCQVQGSFVTNPATGKTANFLATFPANWNGKYLQMGCSGHCGQFAVGNAATPVVTITNQGYPGQIIAKGYASFATDEGHVGFAGGSWAVKGPGQA